MTKPTKWHVRPAKTQISLSIRPDWSESSLSAWRKLGALATHWAHSEDSDQTGRMPKLIWIFAGRTVILLALSRGGSFILFQRHLHNTAKQLHFYHDPQTETFLSIKRAKHTGLADLQHHIVSKILITMINCMWASSWENVSSGVSDEIWLKLACSATEAS